jgi:glycosyltransferase involved in cell wall biosynthesis
MSLLSVVIPSYNEEGNIKRTSEVISGILENASIH